MRRRATRRPPLPSLMWENGMAENDFGKWVVTKTGKYMAEYQLRSWHGVRYIDTTYYRRKSEAQAEALHRYRTLVAEAQNGRQAA